MNKPRQSISVILCAGLLIALTSDGFAGQRRTKRRKSDPPPINCVVPVCTSITAAKTVIDFGDRVRLTANASDPDGDALTFTWQATGGSFEGEGSSVDYIAPDVAAGAYQITVLASDDYGHVVECSVTINVGPGIEHP